MHRGVGSDFLDRVRRRAGPAAFEALYGSLAPYYDRISGFFFAGQWVIWQRTALEFVRGTDVLELGYGTGEIAVELCRRGHAVVGIDRSPRMRLQASRKCAREGCTPRLLLGSASALPLPNGSVDTIVSTFPSSYIVDPRTWREARRILRPGGRVVIVLSGELLPVDRCSKLLLRFHALVYGERGSGGAPCWPAIPGFRLTYHSRGNERGIAHLLVAERCRTDAA